MLRYDSSRDHIQAVFSFSGNCLKISRQTYHRFLGKTLKIKLLDIAARFHILFNSAFELPSKTSRGRSGFGLDAHQFPHRNLTGVAFSRIPGIDAEKPLNDRPELKSN
jgi:hypothetical protein